MRRAYTEGYSMPSVEDFAAALRAERARADLSQEELGARIGYDKSTISIYEKGTRQSVPSRDVVVLIEDALSVGDSRLLTAAGYLPRSADEASDLSTAAVATSGTGQRLAGFRRGDELNARQVTEIERAVEAMIEGVLERDKNTQS